MSVDIVAWINPKEIADFAALKGKIRVSAAVALTRTAKDAQTALKAEAASAFHLRNKWVPQGIRIDPANPATLTAKVGSVDKYMARHVIGDPKPANQHLSIRGSRGSDGRLATGGLVIGEYDSIGDAQTHSALRRKLNRIDGQKKKTFQIIGRGGSVMIVRRAGKKRTPLEVLATIKDGVTRLKPIFFMEAVTDGVVAGRFGTHLEAAIDVGRQRP